MSPENWIEEKLTALREDHQLRSLKTLPSAGGKLMLNGQLFINFSSNDYLDFINRNEIREAGAQAINEHGSGSGSSRLVTGTLSVHETLETAMARHKDYPAALLFGSGFLANIGTVTSIVGRGDTVIADRLVHASLIDAIRLSEAQLIRYNHNDLSHADACFRKSNNKKGRVLLVTESVFSMDGDIAPLAGLAALASEHGAMFMVDEAHASGVFGPQGRGLIALHNLQDRVNISMSTLSKALGSYGGIVACSQKMREWLINTARSFIYTTALPPGVCASGLKAIELLDAEPELGETLLSRAALFKNTLTEYGFKTGLSESQIVPVIIGENEDALKMADAMKKHHMLVSAIRPPTVPRRTARLRFSITLAHTEEDLLRAADQLRQCVKKLNLQHILHD